MAVTRIKNNQITDTTITGGKLVNNTITAGKLENNMTYGSNLTITGNLTVNGATTTVSTTNTTVEDTIMVLNSDASGSNTTDIGIYGERGTDASVFMGWDESADQFALVETSSAGTDTAMTITDYAPLRLGALTADDTVTATGNVTGGNLLTGGLIDATGNIDGANLNTGGLVSATGNVTGGNLVTGGLASVTGNVTGGNLVTGGLASVTGNITGGNLITGGLASVTGNITGGNLLTGGLIDATGSITAGTTVTATGNITGGNVITAGLTSTGDLTVLASATIEMNENVIGNVADPVADQDAATKAYVDSQVSTGFDITDGTTTQNISSGDTLTFAGTSNEVTVTVSATDTLTIGLPDDVVIAGNLTVQGSQTVLNTATLQVEDKNIVLANGAADSAAANGAGITVNGASATIIYTHATTSWDFNKPVNVTGAFDATGNVTGGNIISDALVSGTSITTSGTVVATGNITGGNLLTGGLIDATGSITAGTTVTATGNVAGGNLTTAGQVAATGNITGGNLITGGIVTATGNVSGGNVTTAGVVTATGNVTGGNLVTGGLASVTGNITGGNLLTGGLVSATGNVTGGNLTTGGDVDATGSGTFGNVTIDTDDITTAGATLTINEAGADKDFRVESNNNANMLFVDGGADQVIVGAGSGTTDVSFKVATTDSVMIATGNTAQRPATGVVGMLRFNTTADSLEQYSSADGWETVGVPAFTVIASETFSGDNSTVAFTLSDSQTTASCIVSINGVVQLPTTAYGVSGTTLTFTEAPLSGDTIEVRKITTTTTVTNISSSSGGATVEANNETEIDIKGNLMPAADATYSIGNATVGWTTVYAEATSAQYADLAEKYEADADYEPGTVLHFGGDKEVTECDQDHCTKVAGVVSTSPAYRMNDGLEAEHTAMVALVGRVPCKVQGPVAKGDIMVSAGNGKARAEADPKVGAVIGKALEDFNGEEGVIEVVIGKH